MQDVNQAAGRLITEKINQQNHKNSDQHPHLKLDTAADNDPLKLSTTAADVKSQPPGSVQPLPNPLSVAPQSVLNPLESVNPQSVAAPTSVEEVKSHGGGGAAGCEGSTSTVVIGDANAKVTLNSEQNYTMCLNQFMNVCDDVEKCLATIRELQRQYMKFDSMASMRTPADAANATYAQLLQPYVDTMLEDKRLLRQSLADINEIREMHRAASGMGATTQAQRPKPNDRNGPERAKMGDGSSEQRQSEEDVGIQEAERGDLMDQKPCPTLSLSPEGKDEMPGSTCEAEGGLDGTVEVDEAMVDRDGSLSMGSPESAADDQPEDQPNPMDVGEEAQFDPTLSEIKDEGQEEADIETTLPDSLQVPVEEDEEEVVGEPQPTITKTVKEEIIETPEPIEAIGASLPSASSMLPEKETQEKRSQSEDQQQQQSLQSEQLDPTKPAKEEPVEVEQSNKEDSLEHHPQPVSSASMVTVKEEPPSDVIIVESPPPDNRSASVLMASVLEDEAMEE